MLKHIAAQLDKRNWRRRIEEARTGFANSSCANLSFYEDDLCFIRYRKTGRGPVIVFLCDGPATLELYDELIQQLAPHFTVIAFETPGNGFSVPKPGFSFDFAPTNDAIARFLRATAGEQSILAFSCGGAYAAVDVATRYPALCHRLVILQAPSWEEEVLWKQRRDPRGLVSTPFVGQFLFPKMIKSRTANWYELSMANSPLVERFCSCTLHTLGEGATFALPTLFQKYLTGNLPPFEAAEQPALAIWGTQDGSHASTDKQSSSTLARSVEIKTFHHVGHFPELEDPAGFKRTLQEFLA